MSDEFLPYLRRQAERAGRDPANISVSLKRSLPFTDIGLRERGSPHTSAALIGSTQQVMGDLYNCREMNVDHLTYDFSVEGLEECVQAMEHLADRLLPVADRQDQKKAGDNTLCRLGNCLI